MGVCVYALYLRQDRNKVYPAGAHLPGVVHRARPSDKRILFVTCRRGIPSLSLYRYKFWTAPKPRAPNQALGNVASLGVNPANLAPAVSDESRDVLANQARHFVCAADATFFSRPLRITYLFTSLTSFAGSYVGASFRSIQPFDRFSSSS